MNTESSHGMIDVFIEPPTQISGPKLSVGEVVYVTGQGSFSTWITATTIAPAGGTGSPSPSPSPIPPSTLVSTQGSVVGIVGSSMSVNSGYPHGHIPVVLGSSTVYIGGKPTTNSYVQVSGTGSLSGSVNATVVTVWSSAPGSVTISGTVTQAAPFGLDMNAGPTDPSVPVIIDSTTVIAGGILEPGSMVRVTGAGSSSGSVTAVQIVVNNPTPAPSPNQTPTPTPGPISQKHVATAGYLGGYFGTHRIAWSAAAPYLNWALTGVQDANAISTAGIKTMFYTDPNHVQVGDPMYTSQESTFAHDCSGNRVTAVYDGITQYIMDVTSPSLAALYNTVATGQMKGAHFDALFEDNAGTMTGPPNYSAYPCNYSDDAWIAGTLALSQAAPAPVNFNGLSGLNGHDPSLTLGLLSGSNVVGGTFEHCYTDSTVVKSAAWLWQATENTELQAAQSGKEFDCLERNSADGAASIDARQYAYASFLLTYNPSTSTMWETFASPPTNLAVFPEEQLVALNPLVATPTQITAIETNGGAFGREYAQCYIAGNFVGPCAVAVNSDPTNTYPFPYPQYTHSLVLSGEGVLDGGTISTSGAAPASYMSPLSSAIVFP